MVATTEYERTGGWSLTEDSYNLIQKIDEETDAIVEKIGTSFFGKNLYSVTMGKGEKVVFISGGVHRSEPAAHEVVQMRMRDMAYNIEGKYTTYLNNYKYVFVPTVQVDSDTARVSPQGININRDGYQLESPEMAVLMKKLVSENPQLYVDFHERAGAIPRLEFIDTMSLDPNSDRYIKQNNARFVSEIRSDLETKGYTTLPYPNNIIGPGMTISIAALLGTLAMTPETHHQLADTDFRINALKDVFDLTLSWHHENSTNLESIRKSYVDNLLKQGEKFYLLNGDNGYYLDATRVEISIPEAYKISDISKFKKWEETYNIEVGIDGVIPMNQTANRLLPHLLDPSSDMKVIDAVRIESNINSRTDGRYSKAKYAEWEKVFIKSYS